MALLSGFVLQQGYLIAIGIQRCPSKKTFPKYELIPDQKNIHIKKEKMLEQSTVPRHIYLLHYR